MKTITVKLKIDPQKYEAAQQFMQEKGLDIGAELSEAVDKFYLKYVPAPVRKYIEKSTSPTRPASENSPTAATDEASNPGISGANLSGNTNNFCSLGSGEV